jgi:hypothetical protein
MNIFALNTSLFDPLTIFFPLQERLWACLAKTCTEQSSGLLILKLVKSDDAI